MSKMKGRGRNYHFILKHLEEWQFEVLCSAESTRAASRVSVCVCHSYTLLSSIQTTDATLPPSDHISVSCLQAVKELSELIWSDCFGCFYFCVFVTLSCLYCSKERESRDWNTHTMDLHYPMWSIPHVKSDVVQKYVATQKNLRDSWTFHWKPK